MGVQAARKVNRETVGGAQVTNPIVGWASRPSRRYTTKLWMAVLLITMAVLLLAAGCGDRSGNSEPGRDAHGRIILDFWNGFTGLDCKTMQGMVDQFQRENPDIKVRMQIIPWGLFFVLLFFLFVFGCVPDVFIVHAARLPEFASFGKLRPVSDLLASTSPRLTSSDFAPKPWSATFYNGVQYALPLDTHPEGLYY